jgi:Helix-turn-helix domain
LRSQELRPQSFVRLPPYPHRYPPWASIEIYNFYLVGCMARRTIRSLPQRAPVTGSLNLATQRQKKGVSLEEIADVTKISIRFLRAIEDEEFDKLPGGIFNTSYMRQYAAVAGVEESSLLTYYDHLVNPVVPDATPAQPERSLLDRWFRVPAPAPRS